MNYDPTITLGSLCGMTMTVLLILSIGRSALKRMASIESKQDKLLETLGLGETKS